MRPFLNGRFDTREVQWRLKLNGRQFNAVLQAFKNLIVQCTY
jgi:hypothetical protein